MEAGFEEIEMYTSRRKNMVTKYIATRPIFDLYLEAERQPGARVTRRWWEQGGINTEGIWEEGGGGGGQGRQRRRMPKIWKYEATRIM